jgi:hypothetical protein
MHKSHFLGHITRAVQQWASTENDLKLLRDMHDVTIEVILHFFDYIFFTKGNMNACENKQTYLSSG